jgi:hypothetical protein
MPNLDKVQILNFVECPSTKRHGYSENVAKNLFWKRGRFNTDSAQSQSCDLPIY